MLTKMRMEMKREQRGSAHSHPKNWIAIDDRMTPTDPRASARMCRNMPNGFQIEIMVMWFKGTLKKHGACLVVSMAVSVMIMMIVPMSMTVPMPMIVSVIMTVPVSMSVTIMTMVMMVMHPAMIESENAHHID
jgi:hypothetical protein